MTNDKHADLEATANPTVYRRAWWNFTANKTCKCAYCHPHRVENYSRRARPDRYKNPRRQPGVDSLLADRLAGQ